MSTEVTPETLRLHAEWVHGDAVSCDKDTLAAFEAMKLLLARADRLEHEQRPLPTVPGWYPNIVVERGGESCTGALRSAGGYWATAGRVDEHLWHFADDAAVTIRWAEQDGKTPGQTAYKADGARGEWDHAPQSVRDAYDRMGSAVLAAHGTPTAATGPLQELSQRGWPASSQVTLTPVGEHTDPGTRGLLPVVLSDVGVWRTPRHIICAPESEMGGTVLADPRPDVGRQL